MILRIYSGLQRYWQVLVYCYYSHRHGNDLNIYAVLLEKGTRVGPATHELSVNYSYLL
jgi:hypothetical protein